MSSPVKVGRPCSRATDSTPCTRVEPTNGTTRTGPTSMSPDATEANPASSGRATRSGTPVENTCPDSDPCNGTRRPGSTSAPIPTATSTLNPVPSAVGSTTATRSAPPISRVRSAIRCSGWRGSSASSTVISCRVIVVDACSHSPRVRAVSYRREFSMATAAVAASALVSCSSSAVNPPRVLSAR